MKLKNGKRKLRQEISNIYKKIAHMIFNNKKR